jgi:hypothetical protein
MPRGGYRPGAGRKPAAGESYEAARRRKESALADLRVPEVNVRRGNLLDADAVARSGGTSADAFEPVCWRCRAGSAHVCT